MPLHCVIPCWSVSWNFYGYLCQIRLHKKIRIHAAVALWPTPWGAANVTKQEATKNGKQPTAAATLGHLGWDVELFNHLGKYSFRYMSRASVLHNAKPTKKARSIEKNIVYSKGMALTKRYNIVFLTCPLSLEIIRYIHLCKDKLKHAHRLFVSTASLVLHSNWITKFPNNKCSPVNIVHVPQGATVKNTSSP